MTFDVTPYLNNKNSDYSPLLSVMKKMESNQKKHRLLWTKMEKMYYICTQL